MGMQVCRVVARQRRQPCGGAGESQKPKWLEQSELRGEGHRQERGGWRRGHQNPSAVGSCRTQAQSENR
jgi:hypothetical protein